MGGRGNYLLHSIRLQDDFSRIINVSNLYRAPNGPIVIARWTGFVARCRLSREQLIFTCQRRLADEPRRVLIRRKGPMRATSKIPSVRVCALIRSSPTRKKERQTHHGDQHCRALIFTPRKCLSGHPDLAYDRYYSKESRLNPFPYYEPSFRAFFLQKLRLADDTMFERLKDPMEIALT